MAPRILIADIRLAGRPHHDWKEGYELMYAFRNLGIHCDVAGPNGVYSELDIPRIASRYSLIIISENYPQGVWRWWNWDQIRTPKVFFAIDTHLVNFLPWIQSAGIGAIAFNNRDDIAKYPVRGFWLPYASSSIHHMTNEIVPKTHDVLFVGGSTPERKELCARFSIPMVSAFGPEYVRTMKSAKICFNKSISYDLNSKYFEIMGSGTFMLTNYNQSVVDIIPEVEACMYRSDDEIGDKIKYFLEHEEERERIAAKLLSIVKEHHTWESRCRTILSAVGAV